jgi:hypothetical protein
MLDPWEIVLVVLIVIMFLAVVCYQELKRQNRHCHRHVVHRLSHN